MNFMWRSCLRNSKSQSLAFRNSYLTSSRASYPRFFNTPFRSTPKSPHEVPFAEEFSKPRIFLPIVFAIGVGTGAHFVCATLAAADTEVWNERLGSNMWGRKPTTPDMIMARLREKRDHFKSMLQRIHESTKEWPEINMHAQRMFVVASNSWLISGESAQLAWKITMINALVFLAWRVPRWHAFMQSNFTHNVMSRKTITLLTSVFSHASPFHLLFNTVALTSFAPAVCNVLYLRQQATEARIQDSTPIYHFVAFFLAAGASASLVSHLAQAAFKVSRLSAQLSDPAKLAALSSMIQSGRPLLPSSLGASGAIYSMITYCAMAIPSAGVNIMFIPISIPIGWAVTGTVCLDILGIIRGWSMFDHWAHLGGAGFGLWYYYNGASLWEKFRIPSAETAQKVMREIEPTNNKPA